MNVRLTIDKAGRAVVLKPLREELHLEPGDGLEMENAGVPGHIAATPFGPLSWVSRNRVGPFDIRDGNRCKVSSKCIYLRFSALHIRHLSVRKLVARVMLFAKHAQLISRAQKCKTQPNTQIQMAERLRTLRI